MSVGSASRTAEDWAEIAQAQLEQCIDDNKSFVLEAGAGAGKTFSLVYALKYIIEKNGPRLLRNGKQVACITYTNTATEEIASRIDRSPLVIVSTIHSLCWSLLSQFPSVLKKELPNLSHWPERLEESGGLNNRNVIYSLGYPSAKATDHVSLHHDDVLALMIRFLDYPKFRTIFVDRYPILFIDEYQDTDKNLASALIHHFVEADSKLLIGLFGDHWQKIYPNGCGAITSSKLQRVDKHSNFRSSPEVVEVLSQMRPELPQVPSAGAMEGSVRVFHTNSWGGTRRGGAHWKGDLPIEEAHQYLTSLMDDLRSEGWNFESEESKILMLTHNILAGEQGYRELLDIYEYTDSVMKKEDDYFAFFVDVLEPASTAYTSGRIGEMFSILGDHQPHIRSGADKRRWVESLDVLTELQSSATVGDVIDHLAATHCPPLPGAIVLRESQLREYTQTSGEEMPRSLMETSRLRELPYSQVRSVASFINGNTPFSTKHGVKGLEFERVLVVVGRGWNHYNFNQMLEWVEGGVPAGKEDSFERSRNLFYVTCSRPKKHLVLLITEQLSESALRTLSRWFGADHVEGLDLEMAVTAAHSDL